MMSRILVSVVILAGVSVHPAAANDQLAQAIRREAARLAFTPQAARDPHSDWSQVQKLAVGTEVQLQLRDTLRIRRTIVSVTETELIVRNLADPRTTGRDDATWRIPRGEIVEISKENKGHRSPRRTGALIGLGVGVGVAALATAGSRGPDGSLVFLRGAPSLGGIGAVIGFGVGALTDGKGAGQTIVYHAPVP